MASIKVLLLDNEEVFRHGLAKLIDEQPHMKVVHQCADSTEALKKAEEMKPDVVLVAHQSPETNIVEFVTDIARSSPEAKVALFAHSGEDIALVESMRAGAKACLAKNISAEDLVRSIELVSSGRIIISPEFAERFLGEITQVAEDEGPQEDEEIKVLSQRELEVVQLVARGASNKEIAAQLFIAENTVKVHVKNILYKLELRNRQQLVAYAVLRNWVTLDTDGEAESTDG